MAFVEQHPETVSGFNKNEVAKITKGKIRQEKIVEDYRRRSCF